MDNLIEKKVKRETVVIECNAKKIMPDLIWLLKARSVANDRPTLQYLNIDDTGACCTDGRRLHLLKDKSRLPALANGLYAVSVLKDRVIFEPKEGEFPNYQQVIPSYSADSAIKIDLDVSKHDDINVRLSCSLITIAVKVMNIGGINIAFLKDLLGYTWQVSGAEVEAASKPVFFTSGSLLAVLMPIRL